MLKRLRGDGCAVAEIALSLGVSDGAIRARLHVLGISKRKLMRWSGVQKGALESLRLKGLSAGEIALEMGVRASQVNYKLCREGLTGDGQRDAIRLKSMRAVGALRVEETQRAIVGAGYSFGYVLGVLRGDGSIWKGKCGGHVLRLRVRDEAFADKFFECLRSICPDGIRISRSFRVFHQKESEIRTPDSVHTMTARTVTFHEVTCSNPGVVGLLDKHRRSPEKCDTETVRGFIDGLWDSEGFFIKTRGYAGLKMKDHGLVRWMSGQLATLGVENKVYTTKSGYLSRVSVHRKSAVKKFCEVVKFSIPQKEEIRLKLLRG